MFQFDDVSLKIDNKMVLEEINWKGNSKQRWAILGLNGSGKTSLLKLMTGYLWPSEGSLTVLEHKFGQSSIPELRKKIGWVSADIQQKIPNQELAEQIVLSGKFASIGVWENVTSEDQQKAKEVLIKYGGEHLVGRNYGQLSQGERQKVLIARAMMNDPELLIFDEACSGLDMFARDELLNDMTRIGKEYPNKGLIVVTHHVEEIPPSFNCLLLLKRGRVFAQGKRDLLLTQKCLSEFYDKKVTVSECPDGRLMVLPV